MLDAKLPVTLQYQLKSQLYEKIESGEWPEGFKIPSENELCDEYGISRITVREVLKEMVQSGYLMRQQGKGTFVTAHSVEETLTSSYSLSEDLEQKGRVSEFILRSFNLVDSTLSSRNLFNLKDSDKMFEIIRLRTIDGKTYAWEKALVPEKFLLSATAQDINKDGLYPTIKRLSGLYPVEAEEKIESAICPDYIAEQMQIPKHSAVFKIKRNTKSMNGYIEKCESYIVGQVLSVKHSIHKKFGN